MISCLRFLTRSCALATGYRAGCNPCLVGVGGEMRKGGKVSDLGVAPSEEPVDVCVGAGEPGEKASPGVRCTSAGPVGRQWVSRFH